jgi:hypothetical protein
MDRRNKELVKEVANTPHWQVGTPTQMMLEGDHLIYFKKNVKVVYLEKAKSGGNENIRRMPHQR